MVEQVLEQKVWQRTAVVAVMGLGYVGLPLSTLYVRAGFRVLGFDVNEAYVNSLRAGVSVVGDVPSSELQAALATGRFTVTCDPEALRRADIYLICVPTPLSKTRQPDLSFIQQALKTLTGVWEAQKLVVLESTTYPGTTDELLLPLLSQGGLELDRDFLLAFSPERVDPGNTRFPLHRIPKVVGGVSAASTRVAATLYESVFERVHTVSNARVAELAKLLENTYRNVNIALVNEFAQICDNLNTDVWEVIEAAKTKPFGFTAFYPGPGIGGHCIPLDPQYLVYKARLAGYEPRLVALADQINHEMPRYVVRKVMDALNEQGKALKGARVLVVGVAYKPDVPDLRESPALTVLEELSGRGATIAFSDPLVPRLRLGDGRILETLPLNAELLAETDLVVITTAHSTLDYRLLEGVAWKVLDTRNALGKPREPLDTLLPAAVLS